MIEIKNKIPQFAFALLIILWIPLSLTLGWKSLNNFVPTYFRYFGKFKWQRIKIHEPDISPALKLCRELTPKDAEILFINFPFDRFFRIQYYLYPRKIIKHRSFVDNPLLIKKLCQKKHLDYCVIYNKNYEVKLKKNKNK